MTKIVLTGYMGAGKTLIGELLAQKIGFSFFDLDHVIEKENQKTIPELFLEKGEIGFRKVEHLVLNAFLNEHDNFVLSLGGGTPCYANNHFCLQQQDIASFYLKASVEVLANRLQNDTVKRPLLTAVAAVNLEDFIAKHLFDRNYYYHQAKKVINTDGKSPEAIVAEILKHLA